MILTGLYLKALEYALRKHSHQKRRGTEIPYFTHVMAVSSLCLEFGGSEEQAIGGLLHDVIEDCHVSQEELVREFGERVARIVVDCTDSFTQPKLPWRERKERYVAHLDHAHPDSLLVSACDKLHNARAIVRDVGHLGPVTWQRFRASPAETLWYYSAVLEAFSRRWETGTARMVLEELAVEIERMRALVEAP